MKYNLLGQTGPEGQTNPDAPEGGPYIYEEAPGLKNGVPSPDAENKGLNAKGTPVDEQQHKDKVESAGVEDTTTSSEDTTEDTTQETQDTKQYSSSYTVEQIMDYQTILKGRGFYTGAIDGIIGPATRAAAQAMIDSDAPQDIDATRGDEGKALAQALDAITQTSGLVYGSDLNSGQEQQQQQTTQDTTMYWGRYDSGSWFTSTLDGIEDDGTWKWGWELPEYAGLGQDAFTSDKDLNDILKSTTDGSSDGVKNTTTTTTTEVSKGFQGTQIWEVDGKQYVVFTVPDTEPALYIRYEATDTLLDLYYSSGRERPDVKNISKDSDEWINSSMFGSLAEVDEDILTGAKEPFQGLVDKWDIAKEYRPWLEDTELYNIWLEAFIEDRDILDEEWKTTEWWRTHTKEERDWLLLSQGKELDKLPADAQAYLDNNRIKVRDMFKAAGVTNIESIVNSNGESFLDWFAFNFTSGKWTETATLDQVKAISDPTTGIELDDSVNEWLDGKAQGVDVATTKKYEAQVENLANEWLGPLYGVLTDDQKATYAGMIRNSETEAVGVGMVIDKLKAMRGTLFGDYNENLTYNEIATPWRNYSFQLLGQRMDETSSTFVDVIKANDQKTATQLLTEWGINNNSATLLDKVTDEIGKVTGAGQVVRGIST